MKKFLFAAVLILSIATGITAFASSADPTDTEFYDVTIRPLMDFQGETVSAWYDGNNKSNARVGYAKDGDNNIFLYAKGNDTVTSSKAYQWPRWDGLFTDLNSKAVHLGTSGEYVMQWRVKFNGRLTYTVRMGCSGVDTKGLAAATKEIKWLFSPANTTDSVKEDIYYTIKDGTDTNKKTSLEIVLNQDTWYTLKAIYNIDTKKTSLSILDTDGTWKTTGDLDIPAGWNPDLAFIALRGDMTGDNGYSIDDFIISKTINKPVTVKYDNTKGSVTYNGSAVVSEAETAVPYNSAAPAVFSIAAKDGYRVSDVKVNGESLGNAEIDSYSFTNVKAAQTLEVTFEEANTTEAPEIAKSSILPTTYKVMDGEIEKTYPAFIVYGTLSDYTNGYNGEYGIYAWEGNGNRDSEALRLVAHADDEHVASATAKRAFAIKLFGNAITSGSEYSAQAFVDNATGEKLSVTVE